MTDWTGFSDGEPTSISELTSRESSPPILRRSVSDRRLTTGERLTGALLPLCLSLMALCLVGSAVLVWLALR